MAVLEAKGLNKRYTLGEKEVNALQGVDFAFPKGELVALDGPFGQW